MRVLITGAEGFAGSHLVDYCLSLGDDVWGTCRPGARTANVAHQLDHITLRVGDLTQPEFLRGVLRESKFDALFHLAGISYVKDAEREPAKTYESNLLSGIHLLEAVRTLSHQTRVVMVSSAEVYGPVAQEKLPVREDYPFAPPVNIFAAGKAALELAAHPLITMYGLHVVMARPFNHTGPRQRADFVCSTFAEQVAKVETGGEPVIYCGDLSPRRDFSDVRDIVRGYRMLALQGAKGEAYNLATGTSVTVKEILDILVNMARVKVEIRPDPARLRGANQVMDVRGSIDKIKAATGWLPEIPLEKTLRDLLNWHRGLRVAAKG
ncbi:MAG TPA: GDP-mannose 4,6-dehydratase [Planctomycetota bacterium]|nr:GDP-mannose 4,6-dehydratase [Planctomycetota bacterium]